MTNLINWSDRAESIKIVGFPKNYQISFYDEASWGGNKVTSTVSSSTQAALLPNLSIYWRVGVFNSFANKITSFKSL